jgi:hypothetical protein
MPTIHLQMSHTGATTLGVSGFFYRSLSLGLIFDINKREDVPSNLKKRRRPRFSRVCAFSLFNMPSLSSLHCASLF